MRTCSGCSFAQRLHLLAGSQETGAPACGHDAFAMGEKEGPAAIVADSIWLTHFCYSNDRVFSDWLHGHWRACFGRFPTGWRPQTGISRSIAMQEWLLAARWQRERHICRLRHGIGS